MEGDTMKTVEIREGVHKTVIKQVGINLYEVTLYEDMSYMTEPRWVALGPKEVCRKEYIAEEYGIAM